MHKLLLIALLGLSSVSFSQVFKCYGRDVNNTQYTFTSNMTPLLSNIKCSSVRYEKGMGNKFLEGVICLSEHAIALYFPKDDSWACTIQPNNQWRCYGVGKYNARYYLQFICRWENGLEISE